MNIQALYRYPVKGLSAESLPSVDLLEAQGFPMDRAFAVTDGSLDFNELHPVPAPKTQFLMLAKYEKLAKLKTRFIAETSELDVSVDDASYRYKLIDEGDKQRLAVFLESYLGVPLPGTPRVVSAAGHQFTDVSVHSVALMRSISLINLDTVADLGRHLGRTLDPLRFRANLYFDGVPAWAEMDWVGQHLRVGEVVLKVVRRTKRCAATSVDPLTGSRDMNLPLSLREYVDHGDLGIYAEVIHGGQIKPGDAVHIGEA